MDAKKTTAFLLASSPQEDWSMRKRTPRSRPRRVVIATKFGFKLESVEQLAGR